MSPICLAAAAAMALQLASPASVQVPPPATSPPAGKTSDEGITVTGRAKPLDLTPLVGGDDFIDPMGEPYHSPDKLSGAEHWFRRVDADGNGRLTLKEVLAAANRFFDSLDMDRNEVIEPVELDRYEAEVAPEIHVVSTYGDLSKVRTDSDGKIIPPPYPTRLGAGRYGYLSMPNPVSYADTNLDRGITRQEFDTAAEKRFKMLDRNGDGAIIREELPRLSSPDKADGR